MSESRTIAIIPAFNEERTIGSVVRAALRAPAVDSVIVVDDGSSDDTSEEAKLAYVAEDCDKPFEIVPHIENRGKSEAIFTGFDHAKQLGGSALRTIVSIDADLLPIWSRQTDTNQKIGSNVLRFFGVQDVSNDSLSEETFIDMLANRIDELVQPVLTGESIMAIGTVHRNTLIDKLRSLLNWGALSGMRAIDTTLFETMLEKCAKTNIAVSGWEIEAALNTYTRRNLDVDGIKLNRRITKFLWRDIVNLGSRKKTGSVIKGIWRMLQIHSQASYGFVKFARKL